MREFFDKLRINIHSMWRSFKVYLKGIRKIEYTYDLNFEKIPITNIISMLANEDIAKGGFNEYKTIIDIINALPLNCNVSINVDYTLEKVDNPTELLYQSLKTSENSKVLMKFDVDSYMSCNQKQINGYVDVYTIGIDNNIWKFSFKPYVLYNYLGRDYDEVLFNLLISIVNTTIHILQLRKMSKLKIDVNLLDPSNHIKKREKMGYYYICTPEFNISTSTDNLNYSVDDIIPKWSEENYSNDMFDAINDISGNSELNKKITSTVQISD